MAANIIVAQLSTVRAVKWRREAAVLLMIVVRARSPDRAPARVFRVPFLSRDASESRRRSVHYIVARIKADDARNSQLHRCARVKSRYDESEIAWLVGTETRGKAGKCEPSREARVLINTFVCARLVVCDTAASVESARMIKMSRLIATWANLKHSFVDHFYVRWDRWRY